MRLTNSCWTPMRLTNSCWTPMRLTNSCWTPMRLTNSCWTTMRLTNTSAMSSAREAMTCLPGHEGRGKQREPTTVNRQPQRAEATGLHGERLNHIVRREGYALLARPRGAREAARANPCQPPTSTGWGDRTAWRAPQPDRQPGRLRPACPATKGAGSSASQPLSTSNHKGLRRQDSMASASTKSSARKATPCLPGHKGRGKQREPTPVNRQPQRAEATGQHG
jgi:hypothetical protein